MDFARSHLINISLSLLILQGFGNVFFFAIYPSENIVHIDTAKSYAHALVSVALHANLFPYMESMLKACLSNVRSQSSTTIRALEAKTR